MATTNKEIWQQINDAFENGDMKFYEAHLANDIHWNILGNEKPIIGKKEFLEVMKMQDLESFPEITITNIVAEGDYVVVESTGKATIKTGKQYNQTYCDIYQFKDGKIQNLTTYLDTALSNKVLSED